MQYIPYWISESYPHILSLSYPHILYFIPVSAFTDACTAAHVLTAGNSSFLKFRKREQSYAGKPKLFLWWGFHLLHVFWILSLGLGLLKAEVYCLLFRKNVLCLNTVRLRVELGLLQAANSFIQGMKQQGLQSSQKCFALAQRHSDRLPEAVPGRRGSAAHLGLPGIGLGQKENSFCEILTSLGSGMEAANSCTALQQRIV